MPVEVALAIFGMVAGILVWSRLDEKVWGIVLFATGIALLNLATGIIIGVAIWLVLFVRSFLSGR